MKILLDENLPKQLKADFLNPSIKYKLSVTWDGLEKRMVNF